MSAEATDGVVECGSGGAVAEMPLIITVRSNKGVVLDAVVDDGARKVPSLAVDDEALERSFVGLNTLMGCVEAVLSAEFERRVG